MPREQRPNSDRQVPKRLAGRFHQLKTGHGLTGQYLKWSKSRATAKCGWCPARVQTREHLFKNCPQWKPQQKTLWADVRRETRRGKNRFKIRDLFADERCTRPILDFFCTTEVGRRIGPKDDEPGTECGGECSGRRVASRGE
jgi:transcription elongation factor Elf1